MWMVSQGGFCLSVCSEPPNFERPAADFTGRLLNIRVFGVDEMRYE